MREPVQLNLPFECRECYLKGCNCECQTCKDAHPRNDKLTQKELDALSLEHAWELAKRRGTN